jgi:hypothetical protein
MSSALEATVTLSRIRQVTQTTIPIMLNSWLVLKLNTSALRS